MKSKKRVLVNNNIVLLSNTNFEGVKNLPVFEIKYLSLIKEINEYDALIFTSKNAIFSLDKSHLNWKDIPSYAIAPKTANILKKYDSNIVFTGSSSHGDSFAYELIPLLKNKKVLYIKGKKSVSKLFDILKDNDIEIDELISYETICSNFQKSSLNDNSIIIFTSPSSVNCFFKKFNWKNSYQAVVIGNTTAKYLPRNIKYHCSKIQSIEACVELAKQIAKN